MMKNLITNLLLILAIQFLSISCVNVTTYGASPRIDPYDKDVYTITIYTNQFATKKESEDLAREEINKLLSTYNYDFYKIISTKIVNDLTRYNLYRVKFSKIPVNWESTDLDENAFRRYYDTKIANLDPIEGVWTVSENYKWTNVISGLKGDEESTSIYRIAVIKNVDLLDQYNGYIIESRNSAWVPGRLKVRFKKTGYEMAYEQTWYNENYIQELRNVVIESNGLINYTKSFAEYPINYELEKVLLKIYPPITGISGKSLSNEIKSSGSGFLVSQLGLVVTNYHVIENSNKIEIAFPSSNLTKSASLLMKDINNDLAIIQINEFIFSDISNETIPFSFGEINSVRLGQEVFTLGFPLGSIMGSTSRLSTGRINSIYGIQEDPRLFQISNPLQPGNSGGPLFNTKGELVGVVVSGLNAKIFYEKLGIIPQNVNFAVKASYLENLLEMIPKGDEIINNKSKIPNLSMEDQIEKINPFIVQIKVY